VILPPLLGSGNAGECTVMIEVDPEDAALLDYEGISGAIGRFEADDRGGTLRSLALLVVFFACSFNPLAHGLVVVVLLILVVLDLKGCQYQGSLLPGPTALIVSLSKGGQLRVEGITDEFATLVKTQDVMAKLDGVVEGEMDDGFRVRDENVNRSTKHQDATDAKVAAKATKASNAKRASSSTSNTPKPATKRRKTTLAKKTPQTKQS
jgi:hypothetical protein